MTSLVEKVSVVGGAGRCGLAFSLCVARAGHHVFGIDKDRARNQLIMSGSFPFREECGQELLTEVLERRCLEMTDDLSKIRESDVVVVVLGTPTDGDLAPHLEPVIELFRQIRDLLRRDQLIMIRSTLPPGTTAMIRQLVLDGTPSDLSRTLHFVYAPERALEGRMLIETQQLPQMIGAFDDEGFRRAAQFFSRFLRNECLQLTPTEAEMAKLVCNATRYVQFALANEFAILAHHIGVNVHRVIDAATYDYSRLQLPSPGPNVGGPCLVKDAFFLSEQLPFLDLLSCAYKINQSMPLHILQMIRQNGSIRKICILGMTYKSGTDDTRNSLSYKLATLLRNSNYQVFASDPYLEGCENWQALEAVDCVVLMTPHPDYKDLQTIMAKVGNPDCLYVDLWGFWDEMRGASDNASFRGHDVKNRLVEPNGLAANIAVPVRNMPQLVQDTGL